MSARDIKNNSFSPPSATPLSGTDDGTPSSSSSSSISTAQHQGRSVRIGQVKRKAGDSPAGVTEPLPTAKSLASLSPAMGRSSPAERPTAGEHAQAFIRQSVGREITRERLLAGLPRLFGAVLREQGRSIAAEVGRAVGEMLAGEELHEGLNPATTRTVLDALIRQAILARAAGMPEPAVHAASAALLRALGLALSAGSAEAFDAFLAAFIQRVYAAPERRNALVGVACGAANGSSISERSLQGILRALSEVAQDRIGSDGLPAVMQAVVAAIDDGAGSALALRDTLLRVLLRSGDAFGASLLGMAVAELMKLCPPTPAAAAATLKQVLEDRTLAPHLKGATCMALGAQLCQGATDERISALSGELIELIDEDLETVIEYLVQTASSPAVDACQLLVNALLAWRQDVAGHLDRLAADQRDQAEVDGEPFDTDRTLRHEFDVALRAAMARVTPSASASWLEMLLRYSRATGAGQMPEAALSTLVDELLPASWVSESKQAADTQAQQRVRQARTDALRESIRFGLRLAEQPLDIATAQGVSDAERLALLEIGFLADVHRDTEEHIGQKIERLAAWTAASPWLRFHTLARLFEFAADQALTTANFRAARGHMVKHLQQLIAAKGTLEPASTRDTKGAPVSKLNSTREFKAELASLGDDEVPWVDPRAIDDYEFEVRLREASQPLLSMYREFERASGLDDVLTRRPRQGADETAWLAEIVRHAGVLEVEIRELSRSGLRTLLEGNELGRLRALLQQLDRVLQANAQGGYELEPTLTSLSSSSSTSSSSSQPGEPS